MNGISALMEKTRKLIVSFSVTRGDSNNMPICGGGFGNPFPESARLAY